VNGLRLLPVIFSFLLLGAHYYRAGLLPLTIGCIAVLALLALRRWWVPPVMQALLVLGALEWLRILYVLASMRIAMDQEWLRMALILGGVAAFTGLSALVFRLPVLRRRYDPD